MYVPNAFKEEDSQKLRDFIKNHNFATLVTGEKSHLQASHLPFLLDEGRGKLGVLRGHMAKANTHWQSIGSEEVMVVFQGPHAYISPTWYEAAETVPTWNYVAVHAYGRYQPITHPEGLTKIISDLVQKHEASMPNPWEMESLSKNYLEKMLEMIVGFEIEITRLEGKWKLNQNHPADRREKVVKALRKQGGYQGSQIADLMDEK